MWSIGAYFVSQGLRLAGNLLLTRLLLPEAFGVMALVSVFLMGLSLFSDIGAGPVIIQSKRGEEPNFLNTVFTVQVARGCTLWLIACLGAAPFAAFYEAPILAALLPVAGLNAIAAGFNSTKLFTFNRRLAMRKLAFVEVSTQAVGLLGMVICALIWPSVWSLVVGGLLTAITKAVFSQFLLPGPRNRFHWDRDIGKELFRFGRWIFISTALTFLGGQSDRLIFGKLVSLNTLGLYNTALMLATLPPLAFNRLGQTVIFPVLSRSFEHGGSPTAAFHRARKPVLMAAGWLISGMIAAGPLIIIVLYNDKFVDSGWMLRMLAVGAWFAVLEGVLSPALVALGHPMWPAIGNFAKLICIVTFLPLGESLGGFSGALIGLVACDLVRVLVLSIGAYQSNLRDFAHDFTASAQVAVAAGLGILLLEATAKWFPRTPSARALECLLVLATVTLVWLPSAYSYWRERKGQSSPPAPLAA